MLCRPQQLVRAKPAEVGEPLFPRHLRWLLGLTAAALAMGLAAARWVEPDRRGFGTHERMGLAPCTFRIVFNRPCPSCGMTTAWARAARGQLGRALRANAGGALLAVAAILAVPWLAVSAALGRWALRPPPGHWIAIGTSLAGIVVLTQWLVRLTSGSG